MEEKKTNCGVYQIRNILNNKVYIGSSINLKSRKNQHFNNLENNKHSNILLQNSYMRNKSENFEWVIIRYIEKIEDKKLLKEELLKWEQYYLNEYIINGKIDNNRCYNICLIVDSLLGIKHTKEQNKSKSGRQKGRKISEEQIKELRNRIFTDEWKNKISESKKNPSKEWIKIIKESNSKKVINLDTNKIFNSAMEAAEFYGISDKHIGTVCNGKRNKTGGYRWAHYKGE